MLIVYFFERNIFQHYFCHVNGLFFLREIVFLQNNKFFSFNITLTVKLVLLKYF